MHLRQRGLRRRRFSIGTASHCRPQSRAVPEDGRGWTIERAFRVHALLDLLRVAAQISIPLFLGISHRCRGFATATAAPILAAARPLRSERARPADTAGSGDQSASRDRSTGNRRSCRGRPWGPRLASCATVRDLGRDDAVCRVDGQDAKHGVALLADVVFALLGRVPHSIGTPEPGHSPSGSSASAWAVS